MSTELMLRDDVRELTEETTAILTQAEGFKISTNVSYQLAGDELKRIKAAGKKLDEIRKAITQPMDKAKAAVMDFFRAPQEKLTQAESKLKAAMTDYSRVLEAREAEERKKAEAAAELERERLAAMAAKAAENGETDRADALQDQACAVIEAPVFRREAPKVAGISYREVWKFEITDAAAIPREYLIVDEAAIRKVVQATKGKVAIAGVRVYADKQMAAGAA